MRLPKILVLLLIRSTSAAHVCAGSARHAHVAAAAGLTQPALAAVEEII